MDLQIFMKKMKILLLILMIIKAHKKMRFGDYLIIVRFNLFKN